MLTRRVRTQALAFLVLALLGVSYLSVRYVRLQRLFGDDGYTVHLELADSGGIFSNAEVTYRGVPVGRVGELRLTRTGVSVELHLTSGRHIPSDLKAVVADRSAVGEQYVDLRPGTDTGPYLHDGSVIARADSSLPLPVGTLLSDVDGLARSVPTTALSTVVDELSTALDGSGQNLQLLLDSAGRLIARAEADFPRQAQLIDAAGTVLGSQRAEAGSIRSFSGDLALLAARLRSSDPDLTHLIASGPVASAQVDGLLQDVGSSAGVLISNLLTTSQVLLGTVAGVRQLLVTLPRAVSAGSSVITAQGINVGLSLTFFDPLPCTDGYRGTARRPATDLSAGQPLNTSAGCLSSGGGEVRGAPNSPALVADRNWLDQVADSATSAAAPSTLAGLMGMGN